LASNGHASVIYLHCDGWKRYSSQFDCRTYFDNDTLTYANRYPIREWTHNRAIYSYYDTKAFENFIQEVNSPIIYNINTDERINAIPIIAYHDVEINKQMSYNPDVNLFAQEMKYLHDQGFEVIRLSDLRCDSNTNLLCIKTPHHNNTTNTLR
jgi:hypothetical protein